MTVMCRILSIRTECDVERTFSRLKMLGDFLKASDLLNSSSLASVPSKWLLAHRPMPIATPFNAATDQRSDNDTVVNNYSPVSSDGQYLSFNSLVVSCHKEHFMKLFFNLLLIETLLKSHPYALIQETLEYREYRGITHYTFFPVCLITQYLFKSKPQTFSSKAWL